MVFLMGQNPKCPGYNCEKNQGDKYIFKVYAYSFHHQRWLVSVRVYTMYLVQTM